jgi:hypothetical protein
MRRDREDELDLADVGGEANATTHARKDSVPARQAQAAGHREAKLTSDENKRGIKKCRATRER